MNELTIAMIAMTAADAVSLIISWNSQLFLHFISLHFYWVVMTAVEQQQQQQGIRCVCV